MSGVHLLTAVAVTLGRFCARSESFAAINAALMPVDAEGLPRSALWAEYASCCIAKHPKQVRDARWIAAHLVDMTDIRARGLDADFYREAEQHPDDPTWRLLRQHLEMTLGARLVDHAALAGAVPGETVIAAGMRTSLQRLWRGGWALIRHYAAHAARALLRFDHEPSRGLLSERAMACLLARQGLTAWAAAGVYRRGVASAQRGAATHADDAWPLLSSVLGERIAEVDPAIVAFYANPGRYSVQARLVLNTRFIKVASFFAAVLVGQGLYETTAPQQAQFMVFRRADGSMHFVRELYCGEAVRVFDSDFVVRLKDGVATLYEVFVREGIEVEMVVEPRAEGGLSIRARAVRYHGIALPLFGVMIDFQSRVERSASQPDVIHIEGHVLLQPRSRAGQFLMLTVLRRPKHLGCIHYRATARPL